MSKVEEIRRALYGKMSGDTTLSNLLGTAPAGYSKPIYYQLAPSDPGYPIVLFARQTGTPQYGMKSTATIENDLWLIKGIDRNTDTDGVDAIAARLDALLTDGTISISGATQLYLRRYSDVDYLDLEDGERYVHSGSLYRLMYQT